MSDRTGWVDNKRSKNIIQKAIKEKSEKINKYQSEAKLNDIRLLIVANRRYDSGKLELKNDDFRPDLHGFRSVYFFPYPLREEIICFPSIF